jgi:hypothetical protein
MPNGKKISIKEGRKLIAKERNIKQYIEEPDIATIKRKKPRGTGEASPNDAGSYFDHPGNVFVFDKDLVKRFFTEPEYADMKYFLVMLGAGVIEPNPQTRPTVILGVCKEEYNPNNKLLSIKILGKKDEELDEHPPYLIVDDISKDFVNDSDSLTIQIME